MESNTAMYSAAGAVIAALIAGSISFISMMLSKDQKTSEYRQAWIDSLRAELSEFIAMFTTIAWYEIKAFEESEAAGKAYVKLQEPNWIKLKTTATSVILRLNPKEHTKLIQAISNAVDFVDNPEFPNRNVSQIKPFEISIINLSHIYLKREWSRVKRGEWSFFLTKWGALILAIIATYILCTNF